MTGRLDIRRDFSWDVKLLFADFIDKHKFYCKLHQPFSTWFALLAVRSPYGQSDYSGNFGLQQTNWIEHESNVIDFLVIRYSNGHYKNNITSYFLPKAILTKN